MDGQRMTTATTGHDGTHGQRTCDDDETDDGTDGRTEDDDGDLQGLTISPPANTSKNYRC